MPCERFSCLLHARLGRAVAVSDSAYEERNCAVGRNPDDRWNVTDGGRSGARVVTHDDGGRNVLLAVLELAGCSGFLELRRSRIYTPSDRREGPPVSTGEGGREKCCMFLTVVKPCWEEKGEFVPLPYPDAVELHHCSALAHSSPGRFLFSERGNVTQILLFSTSAENILSPRGCKECSLS
ncbi:hypothetical protein AOLI_G00067650 [Acnodon oligacanthus]